MWENAYVGTAALGCPVERSSTRVHDLGSQRHPRYSPHVILTGTSRQEARADHL
jgi:hypothetical protein